MPDESFIANIISFNLGSEKEFPVIVHLKIRSINQTSDMAF